MSNPSESTSGIMAIGNSSKLEQDQCHFVEKQQLQSSSSQSQPLQFSLQPESLQPESLQSEPHETLATQNQMDNDIQMQDTILKNV